MTLTQIMFQNDFGVKKTIAKILEYNNIFMVYIFFSFKFWNTTYNIYLSIIILYKSKVALNFF